jgi:hypothetical protein
MIDALQLTAQYLMDSILAKPHTTEHTTEKACLARILPVLFNFYMKEHRPRAMGEKEMSAATGISVEKLNEFAFREERFGPNKGIQ